MDDSAARWRQAAGDACVRAELEALFAEVARETALRRPLCRASGRCCRFEQWGHRLYVTGLEAAYTASNLPEGVTLTGAGVAAAQERGGCPFQAGNLCSVHEVKPLACRVYFCDPTAQAWQVELSERAHAQVRALHERHGIPYEYAEWRTLLARLA